MKKFTVLLFVFASTILFAQDEHYSQFKSTGMQLNPALTGETDKWTINLGYRLQWPNLVGSNETTTIGVQRGFHGFLKGIGFLSVSDAQAGGVISKASISIPVSKSFSFSEKLNIIVGLQPTFYQKFVDFSQLTFGDMIDNKLGFQNQTNQNGFSNLISNFDFSSGIIVEFQKVEYGLSVFHLFEPNENFSGSADGFNWPRRWSQFITYEIALGEVTLSPYLQYDVQGDFNKLLIGNTVSFKALKLYTAFRNKDAIIFGMGAHIRKFMLNYTYDYTTSKLANSASGGAHEISFLFRFGRGRYRFAKKSM